MGHGTQPGRGTLGELFGSVVVALGGFGRFVAKEIFGHSVASLQLCGTTSKENSSGGGDLGLSSIVDRVEA